MFLEVDKFSVTALVVIDTTLITAVIGYCISIEIRFRAHYLTMIFMSQLDASLSTLSNYTAFDNS